MRIFFTGATGFVGSRLVPFLRQAGHEAVLLVRPSEKTGSVPACDQLVTGNPMEWGPWWKPVAECGAAVNLAGAPIVGKWTPEKKLAIRESRVRTTRNLVDAIPNEAKGFPLVSASAVGIYGDAGERELDETAPLGTDFLAKVARDWEAEALRAREKGARVVVTRFGIVLGPGGGALAELAKMTKRFLGGPMGSGRQWFSWIHLEDLCRAIRFLLERPDLEGVFNLSSPNPVRQIDLARTLGRVLGRPAFTPAPAFAVKLVLGEFGSTLLASQRMVPRRLLEAGFEFRYPDLEGALREILARRLGG
ncbi:MAG: TIGR01777 family protein [Candidatus Dadabacteria bacterium]|nr:MAG: TIGR01777 family protein [Candidatus Dadabacteria bacterium]